MVSIALFLCSGTFTIATFVTFLAHAGATSMKTDLFWDGTVFG